MSDAWITNLSFDDPGWKFYPLDIRRSISSQFQLLAVFCRHSYEVVLSGLVSFASSQSLVPRMLSRLSFEAQVQVYLSNVKNQLVEEQQRAISLFRIVNEQNHLVTGLSTNGLYNAVNNIQKRLHVIR